MTLALVVIVVGFIARGLGLRPHPSFWVVFWIAIIALVLLGLAAIGGSGL